MPANQFGKVSVGITASTGGLSAGLARSSSLLSGFSNRFRRIELATTFNAGVTALGLLARAIGSVSRTMTGFVQSASNIVEEQNRVGIVFGNSADKILQFARNAQTIGIAEAEALRAAGTFGTLFNNIGMTQEQSAEMSANMTTLSADLASFNNVPVDESLRALRSALVGEVEPIRRLGIVLNDATLRQKAFDMGLTDTVSRTLSPAVRMMAAYASVLEQSNIQHGDAARTIQEYAGQQRVLVANISALATQVGQALLPAFAAMLRGINNIMPNIKALMATLQSLFSGIGKGFTSSAQWANFFANTIMMLAGAISIVTGVFQLFYAGILKVGQGFSEFGAMVYSALPKLLDAFSGFANQAVLFMMTPIQELFHYVSALYRLIGQNDLADRADAIAAKLPEIFANLPRPSEALSDILGFDIDEISNQARRNAEAFGEASAEAFNNGMENITNPLQRYRERLAEEMAAASELAVPAIEDNVQFAFKDAFGGLGKAIQSLPALLVRSTAGEAFRNAIMRGADPRLQANLDRQVADNTNRAANAAEALPERLASVFGNQFATATVSV